MPDKTVQMLWVPRPSLPHMAIVIVTPVLGFLWHSTASTLSLLVDAQTSSRLQPTSPLSTGTPFLDPGIDCSLSKVGGGRGFLQDHGLRWRWKETDLNFLPSRAAARLCPFLIRFHSWDRTFFLDLILMIYN